jgi:plasmid stabilization system protein ParE
MSRNLEEIASEALQMSVESRAALAKRLLDSLDDLAPQEYERMWVEEAARRYQQLKDGTARSSASEDVFARLDARVFRIASCYVVDPNEILIVAVAHQSRRPSYWADRLPGGRGG